MSLFRLKRIPLYFDKVSTRVSLHDMTLLPFMMIFFVVLNVTISLSELKMPALSYGVLAINLVSFLFMLALVAREKEMSQYGFLNFLYLFILRTLEVIKNSIPQLLSGDLLLLIDQFFDRRQRISHIGNSYLKT